MFFVLLLGNYKGYLRKKENLAVGAEIKKVLVLLGDLCVMFEVVADLVDVAPRTEEVVVYVLGDLCPFEIKYFRIR